MRWFELLGACLTIILLSSLNEGETTGYRRLSRKLPSPFGRALTPEPVRIILRDRGGSRVKRKDPEQPLAATGCGQTAPGSVAATWGLFGLGHLGLGWSTIGNRHVTGPARHAQVPSRVTPWV